MSKRRKSESKPQKLVSAQTTPLLQSDFLCILVLVLLPTLLLWSVTFGGKTLAPVDLLLVMSPWRHFSAERFPQFRSVKAPLLDVIQQYYPWRKFYAESLRRGEVPLWNPFMFCGTSFVGNGMSAIFYPLNLPFVFMSIATAFGWVAWLHLVLAGVFMFGFLRQFLSPLAALTGAITFQLCGFFVAWLAYLPLLCTAVWLPAPLWAYEMGCRFPTRLHAFVLASLSLGMALLAGHPQISFYVLWAFCVYVLMRTIATGSLRPLCWGMFVLVGGVMFGGAQLLPLLEMAKISFRRGVETLAAAETNRLTFDQFFRLFAPSFFGDWRSGTHLIWDFSRFNFVERTGYPSVIAFLLSSVGVFSMTSMKVDRGENTKVDSAHMNPIGFSALIPSILGLIFATVGLLAASMPVAHRFMAFGLPGTQAFVGISRALLLFDFGIAILCAWGMETLVRLNYRPADHFDSTFIYRSAISLGSALSFMALCAVWSINAHARIAFHPLLSDFTMMQIYRWLVLTTLGTFFISFAVRLPFVSRPRVHILPFLRTFTIHALPLLIIIDLFSFAWKQHPEAEKGMAFFETPSIRWLKRNLGDQRFIAVGTDAIKHWTPSNTLMVYGLRDAQGSDSLTTMRIFQFLQAWDKNSPLHRAFAVRNFDSPMMDLMAVRYVIAAKPLSAGERKELKLVHVGDLWVYENSDALPRAFALPNWRWGKSPQSVLRQICSRNFNPRQVALLEGVGDIETELERSEKPRPSPSLVYPRRFEDEGNKLHIEIALAQAGVLLVADGAYPGWRVFGQERAVQKWRPFRVFVANYAFRAILLPEGEWRVIWIYFPHSVVIGLFLSLTAIGLTTTVVTVELLGRFRRG